MNNNFKLIKFDPPACAHLLKTRLFKRRAVALPFERRLVQCRTSPPAPRRCACAHILKTRLFKRRAVALPFERRS